MVGNPELMEKRTGNREGEPQHVMRLSLEPCLEAPARARHAVASFVRGSSDPAFSFALELVVSELVKNAVLYGSHEESVVLEVVRSGGEIELRVTNQGERIHMSGLRSHREDGGRGLEIIDALAEGWTIASGPLETSISVRMPFPSGEVLRLSRRDCGYDQHMPSSTPEQGLSCDRVASGLGRI